MALDERRGLTVVATNSEGTLGLSAPAEFFSGDITLVPFAQVRVEVKAEEGLDAAMAELHAIDMSTGIVEPLSRQKDGTWGSNNLPPGPRIVVLLGTGAAPSFKPVRADGQEWPMHMAMDRFGKPPLLRMGRFQVIEGVVTANGKVVAGAKVTLDPDGCGEVVSTDSKGAFRFATGKPAPFLTPVAAESRGLIAYETAKPNQSVEMELDKPAVLEAKFVDDAGAPVPHIELSADWRRADNNQVLDRTARTDAKGLLQVQFPGAGRVNLRLTGDWVFTKNRGAGVAPGTTTRETFQLTRGVPLEVEIVDAEGQPASGGPVKLFFGEPLQARVSPDLKEALRERGPTALGAGRLVFHPLLPGEYEVAVEDHRLGEANGVGTAPGKVRLQFGETAILKGTVKDPAGRPVAQARVMVSRASESRGAATDAQGNFQMALQPGTWKVSVSGSQSSNSPLTVTAELERRRVTTVALVSVPLPQLHGVVVDENGRPVAGAAIVVLGPSAKPLPPESASSRMPSISVATQRMGGGPLEGGVRSAADGTFSVPADGDRWVFAYSESLAAKAAAQSKGGEVKIVLERLPTVVGRVVRSDGKPVGGARVSASMASTESRSDGTFRLALSEKGQVKVRVAGEGHPTRTLDIEAPPTPTEVNVGNVVLEPGGKVVGSVLDAVTSGPVARPWVTVQWTDVDKVELPVAVQDDGKFTVRDLPLREVLLVARADGYAAAETRARPGGSPIRLRLQRNGALEVQVVNAAKAPVPRIDIELVGPVPAGSQRPEIRSVDSDEGGLARFKDLTPGEWTLRSGSTTPQFKSTSVTIAPGQRQKVEVQVERLP